MAVGENAANVGDLVGAAVGTVEGFAEGTGVGEFALYVGTNVGDAVGALLGLADGDGVGDPSV